MGEHLYCENCGERARTYYDKEMFAEDGEGFVTDCGTGGCGFSTGTTRAESRDRFKTYRSLRSGGGAVVDRDSSPTRG